MTRRDFELIATVISECRRARPLFRPAWTFIEEAFARVLATTNPQFDRARFLAACGVEG